MIALNPLAPVSLLIASLAIAIKASSLNSNLTSSSSNNFLYCFTRAFLGLVKISIRASLSKDSNVTSIGSLPTNSGIKPKF